MNGKKRVFHEITNLRALAIFFVVIGHCIILYSSTWQRYTSDIKVPALDHIKAYINIIQMPLFFSISGFLYNLSKQKSFSVFLSNKAKRLLVPWVFFTLAWTLPIRFLVRYPGYEGLSLPYILINCTLLGKDDANAWFMPCLFICFVLSYLYDRLIKKIHVNALAGKLVLMFIALVMLRKEYLLIDYGLIRNPAKYLFYFQLGCLISMFWDFSKKNVYTQVAGVIMFAASSALGIMLFNNRTSILYVVVRILMVVSLYLIIPGKTCRITEFLSSYSLGLYLIHSPLVYITFAYFLNAHPAVVTGINLLFAPLSILITWIFKRTALRVLIGE